MSKADNMVAWQKKNGAIKEERAREAIKKMVKDGREISVAELVRQTGLSKAYFYNNERVHRALEEARSSQKGQDFITPKKRIFDRAMEKQIQALKADNERKSEEIGMLKAEISRYKEIVTNFQIAQLREL